MKLFKTVLSLELSRLFKKKKITALIIFFILLVVLIHDGKNNYRRVMENAKVFKQTETLRVAQYLNYTYYGWYGIKLILIPARFSILSGGIFDQMVSNVNSAERFNIDIPLKGTNLFNPRYYYMDFTGLVLLLGSLVSIVYGFRSSYNKEYLKFLAGLSGPRQSFAALIGVRIIILNGVFLFMGLLSLIWLSIEGINLWNIYLLWYLLIGVLVFTFFMLTGSIFGSFPNKITALVLVGLIYFCSVFVLPFIVFKVMHFKASDLESTSITELRNLELIMKLEQRTRERISASTNMGTTTEGMKNIAAGILKDEYRIFQQSEERIKAEIQKTIDYHHRISTFFPIPFYLSVCNEISGNGYLGFIDFYTFSQERKAAFIEFYINKKNDTNEIREKVESFTKNDENIFFSNSRLPYGIGWGILMHLIYNAILALMSYSCYKRFLTSNLWDLPDIAINLKPGGINYLLTGNPSLRNYPFRYFTKLGGTLPPILVNGLEIPETGFVYLPSVLCFPRSIEKKLIRLVSSEKELFSQPLWYNLLLFALKSRKVIIFDDFFTTLKAADIELVKRMIKKELIVSIYISKDEYLGYSIADQLIFSSGDDTVEPVRLLNPKLDS